MNRSRVLLSAAALLLLLVGNLWGQSGQPSLADVAKHKSGPKAKRVITNDEIPPSPEADNPPPSAGDAAAPGASPSTPGAKGAKGEAKEGGDKAAASPEKQTKLEQLMKEHESLLKVIARLQQQADSATDSSRTEALAPLLEHARENLAANEAEIAKLKASGAASGQGGAGAPAGPASQPAAPPK